MDGIKKKETTSSTVFALYLEFSISSLTVQVAARRLPSVHLSLSYTGQSGLPRCQLLSSAITSDPRWRVARFYCAGLELSSSAVTEALAGRRTFICSSRCGLPAAVSQPRLFALGLLRSGPASDQSSSPPRRRQRFRRSQRRIPA